MTALFCEFYLKVGKRKLFWLPLLLLSLVAYSFSIYNRTIHWDDLLKEYYNESMLSNRWGMVLWGKIMGTLDLVPFLDRFVALVFLIAASVLLSVLFFYLSNRSKEVMPYTVLSSMVLTFPLINEIFEYTGANFQYTGNLALMILAFIYLTLHKEKPSLKVLSIAVLLMILPTSSYEVAIFSYITLLCAVILYENCIIANRNISLRQWIRTNIYYLLPVVIAVAFRIVTAFLLREIYGLSFNPGGSTGISYEEATLTYLIGSNAFRYFVAGLVYFPITTYVVAVIVFAAFLIFILRGKRKLQTITLGAIFLLSVFSLTIIQGVCMQYRTAQAIIIFVAIVAFLLCNIKVRYRLAIQCALLFLCWHQAVFLNNVLSLNNMRSNNEAACIRYVGYKIVSEFDTDKPVVLITDEDYYGGYLGPWIDRRVRANLDSWNGKLFNELTEKYLPAQYLNYKYLNSNVINAIGLGGTHNKYFQYYGFNLKITGMGSVLSTVKDPKRKKEIEDIYANVNHKIPPLGIVDIGECIIVNMLQ